MKYWRLTRGRIWNIKEYEPLYPFVELQKESVLCCTCDTYVTLTDGTGVVHIAPAFGEDDCQGRKKI